MLDMPGGRRRHPRPIPRPGGLAIAIAFGSAIFIFWLIDRLAGHPFLIPEEVRSSRFTLTAIAAVLGMAMGLIDDFLELRARWQFLGQVVVAALIVLAGIHIDFVNDPLSDRLIELSFPVAVAFTMLWIVGMNNALNFIDGLDGLAAGVAAIAAVTLGGLALLPQVSEPPPFAPDRGHFHHRLLDVGLTHQQAVLLIYVMTALLGTLAFMTSGRGQIAGFVGLAVVLGILVMALAQRSSKAEELDPGLYREEADRF